MFKATTPPSSSMGGCTLLLQSWVWCRMPFIAPRVNRDHEWPLVKRWVGEGLNHTSSPYGDLVGYRSRIDHIRQDEFVWLPYRRYEQSLPPIAFQDSQIWSANTALVCFQTVEWHHVDRVKLQIGLVQEIPYQPVNLDAYHDLDMRGNADENWLVRQNNFIQCWNERRGRVVTGASLQGILMNSPEYMMWLSTNSRLYISIDQQLSDPRGSGVGGAVDDREEAPTRPTPQSERHNRNRRAPPTGCATPTRPIFEENQEPVPHRHSISFTPTHQHYEVVNQSVKFTPVQDQHRHSTASSDQDFYRNLFGTDYDMPDSYAYYRSILESGQPSYTNQGGASSST